MVHNMCEYDQDNPGMTMKAVGYNMHKMHYEAQFIVPDEHVIVII